MLQTSGTGSIAERLGAWSAALALADVPDAAVVAAKRCIADTLAVAVAGSRTGVAERVAAHVRDTVGDGPCRLLGRAETASPVGASLANGTAAHALDFDDTSYAGIIHGSAIVLPAVLAAAERAGGDGQCLLEAFIAGAEVTYAVGLTVTKSHYMSGWWATGTCGAIGAAAGSARALGLDGERIATAIALATVQASGMIAVLGTDAKPLLAGRAAAMGVEAALLAGTGLSAPAAAFEDRRGFLQLMNDGQADAAGLGALGQTWRLTDPGICIKTYPICSAAHAAAQLTAALLQENAIAGGEVAQVVCEVPDLVAISLVHDDPASPAEAQFSMPFAVGAILAFGDLGPEHLTPETLSQPALREAMAKVAMRRADDLDTPDMRTRYPESARVTVATQDGREVTGFLGAPAGMPENPLSDAAFDAKIDRCLAFAGWDPARAARLRADLNVLETVADLSALLEE